MATRGYVMKDGETGMCNECTAWKAYNPVVTLVGGSGNTVPVYSSNLGRYQKRGNTVFVDINLSGDGGNEGAGSGQINIALPLQAGASVNGDGVGATGFYRNDGTYAIIGGVIAASATTIAVRCFNNTTNTIEVLTGADQNNAARAIYMHFWYEID